MKLRIAVGIVAILAVFAAVVFFIDSGNSGFLSPPPPAGETVALGGRLYAQHCASCHGINGEGQSGWKTNNRLAPAHDATGHTWEHADRSLFRFIKTGILDSICTIDAGGGMPKFKDTLTDRDIKAVLAFIASRWPPQVRALHDAVNREYDIQDDRLALE